MNYYEELGLDPSASPEEIRQAYRDLARLLHPDRHDENSRRLAECQMRRLNAIAAILTDPKQRCKYDAELAASPAAALVVAAPPRRSIASLLGTSGGVWLVTAAIGIGSICWFFQQPAASPPRAPRSVAEPLAKAQPIESGPRAAARRSERGALSQEASELRRRLELMRAQRDRALARIVELEQGSPDPFSSAPPQVLPGFPHPPELPSSEPGPPGLLKPPLAARLPARFDGTWFYARPRAGPRSGDLYPPEYIEAVIRQEAGVLRGRYRARYQVADRAISPEVLFQFEGTAAGQTAELQWTGGGGSRGQLRLKLTSENAMEASWWATDPGSSAGLASGTAVLIRRQEP